jgi:hypothetical protein
MVEMVWMRATLGRFFASRSESISTKPFLPANLQPANPTFENFVYIGVVVIERLSWIGKSLSTQWLGRLQ